VPATPTAMRQSVAGYVEAVHAAYLDFARTLAPAVRARLPLVAAGRFWVAAAAGSGLHLVATEERLAPAERAGSAVAGATGPLRWTLCFYDPTVLPQLAAGTSPDELRHALGVTTVLYHLALPFPVELHPHHAAHAGTGLAAAHARAARLVDDLRRALPDRAALVDELAGAVRAGLRRAEALLASELFPDDPDLAALARQPDPDPAAVRDALAAAARHHPSPR
jgi:hypothetical protein